MTNLEQGIFDVNGFEISKETKIEELAKRFSDGKILSVGDRKVFQFSSELFCIASRIFYIKSVNFSKNGTITHLIIVPANGFCGISKDYNPHVKETRKICKAWLSKQLGKPAKEENSAIDKSITYKTAWGSIVCLCQFLSVCHAWSITPILVLFSETERGF